MALFDPLLNRVDWKNKWVAVESRMGFPFRPLIGHCTKWGGLPSNTYYIELEIKLLKVVARELGTDPAEHTRVYSTSDLLSRRSLAWCGLGPGLNERKVELDF